MNPIQSNRKSSH
uniref:Uncharacterized protein n=1 Tax=Lepeophtheirus salmonis TaxID=72036 RepID=A0A0K2T4M8_LEPSM